jgi:hypothetical protein
MAREWEFQGAADGDAEKKMLDCIPLRWTAPEVFRCGTHTTRSLLEWSSTPLLLCLLHPASSQGTVLRGALGLVQEWPLV